MAITKIHAIKSTLGKALAYIENPDKTDGQMLVSGYNCEPQTASIDFEMTAVLAHKARNLQRKRSTNLAYHLIQSFSPEDAVTPEQAHELGKKLAFEYTGGKYEYVVATHIDKGHIHNHIMINAVSFYDYKKLRTVPYRTARQIRDISDRLCIEAHLSVIDDPQKIGQLYPENAGKKKSVSNRTEIRKRLNFCLERATGYSQFLSMAKELEITPTIRGKHMSYLLEGAGRSVRDNSLSDTDTFTYAGICARLSDNAQEQKYLRRTITGILSTATGMADFADKLKTAGIETKVKKATGQVLYRATVLDGAWVPEDALGSEFTSEGIEYALKNGEMQIAEDAEITLIDRYQELTIQYPEVCTAAVKLSSRQILSAGKNGLVLQVHDDNGNPAKLMVNKSEVTTSPDGEIIFNVGNDFSYDLVYEDGTHGTIRGAKLIQQIDEENNVLPLAVVLTEDQIKTMSLRGVTIALPSKGIERLFIPEKYVVCNAANGQCAVSLYPNHQYSYRAKASLQKSKAEYNQLLSNAVLDDTSVARTQQALLRAYEADQKAYEELEKLRASENPDPEAISTAEQAADDAHWAAQQAEYDRNSALASYQEMQRQNNLSAQVNQASAEDVALDIKDTQAEIEQLEQLVNQQGVISSPFSGVISNVEAEVGTESTQTFCTIYDTSKGYLFACELPAAQASDCQTGLSAVIKQGDQTETAAITAISENAENDTVDITIQLTATDWKVGPADAEIVLSEQDYDLCLPNTAIHQDNQGDFVFAVEEKNTVLGTQNVLVRIPVTVLEVGQSQTSIEGAISPEDSIVVQSTRSLEAGSKVRVKNENA